MWKLYLFNAALFFVLVPGILLRIPSAGDKFTVALVHAVAFALLHHLFAKYVRTLEFFLPNTKVDGNCPPGATRDGIECRLP